MQFEVDGSGAGPVPPGGLQDAGEAGVEGLEAQDDEGALVGIVPLGEAEIGLNPLDFFVETCKKNDSD